jgi:hypothetical protein
MSRYQRVYINNFSEKLRDVGINSDGSLAQSERLPRGRGVGRGRRGRREGAPTSQ